MRALKLRPSDMLPEVLYVESGVAEIVEKHPEGWASMQLSFVGAIPCGCT